MTLATGAAVGDVTITAYGYKRATSSYGRVHGGAGTVYLRLAGAATDAGTLIVDNADRLPAESDETEISSLVTGTAVGDVILRSNAKLQINTNQSLTVSGSWSNGAVFVAQTGAKVEFAGTNTATVQGNSAFHTLVCTNPFKTVYFKAGSVSTVGGTLTLKGSTESKLTLRSTSSPTQWSLAVAGGAVQSAEYVDVKDSNASDAGITAAHSHDAGNNTNWDFPSGAQTNTWTGTVSTDWGAGANWSLGRAPIEADAAVVISAAATYQPVLDRDDRSVNLFEIENGAGLSLAGHPFLVNSDARIAGALTAVGTETVTFKGDVDFTGGSFTPAQSTLLLAGTAAQAFTADGASCYRLTVRNAGRTVTFADAVQAEYYRCESVDAVYGGDFSAREFRVHSSGGAVTQTFHAASAYAVEELYLLGQTGSTQYLRGSGGAWALNVSRLAHVRHVDVAHSDASAGLTVYPLNSTDSGSNMNWTFGADVKQWTGAGGSSFGEATSWDPPGVPGSGTRVVIDDPDGVTLSSPATVRSLTVGGGTGSVFTVNAALTVLEDLKVARHGTVSLNRPGNTVSNNVWVFEGGTLTHEQNATTEANKIELWVGGDLSLAAGAAVNVTAKGYAPNAGPGGGTQNGAGSSHGGRGSPYSTPLVYPLGTYGSMMSPTNLGSGSYSGGSGGGAVRLTVSGTMSLDGDIVADGGVFVGTWMCGGAGGSVWLTTGALAGSGTISAAGGATVSTYGGGAGGGRIAVRLTSGAAFGSVAMRANGSLRATASNSRVHGGAGTIYRETAAQAGGRGTVTVANNGASPSASARTYILPEQLIVPDEAVQAEVRVEGSGAVVFTTNTALTALNVASINEIIDLGGSAVTTKVSALLRFNGVAYTRGGLYSVADWNGYETPANVSGDGVIQFTRKPAGTIISIR